MSKRVLVGIVSLVAALGLVAAPAQATSPAIEPDAVPSAVISMGDSYSSGLGTGSYTDDCDRTGQAWGHLIFGDAVTERALLACSGAALPDMPAQVAALAALSDGTGDRLVTVTVGGNDVGFADELINCLTPFVSCAGREQTLLARTQALVEPLAQLYDEIQAAAPGDEVIVGGYPFLVPDPAVRSDCPALTGLLSTAERQMIRRVGAALNDAVDAAAEVAGVRSAASALETTFTGHEACANGSQDWLWGMKLSWPWGSARTAGPIGTPSATDVYDPQWQVVAEFVSDSFHPNAGGQAGYAAAFEQVWGS